jgi:hypothetical protein
MDDSFKFRATLRTNDELRERVNNRANYMPETVVASLAELQSRGEQFSDDEVMTITADLQARRDHASLQNSSGSLFNNSDKKLQVKDPDAPAFYSKGVIYGFSILFSVLFGSVMLAININQTQKRAGVMWVVLYGFVFTAIEGIILSSIETSSSLAVVGAILGAMPLNYLFWRHYLGNETVYRPRPVWIPLIIGLAIWIPIMYLIFLSQN